MDATSGAPTTSRATWRSPELGVAREIELPAGELRYFEAGGGVPIVFVHGLLVNANLWRKVVARLAPDFRCIALDLPLGSHALPMPRADLSLPGVAGLIADAIEALGLEDVTLVGNDSGGALAQIVVTRHPARIGRLVLTSCDYRDHGLPWVFTPLLLLARVRGGVRLALRTLRPRALRYLPIAFGRLVKRRIDVAAEESYVRPAIDIPGVEDDARRFMNAFGPDPIVEAGDRLGDFAGPALIAWSREDKVFSPQDAASLAADLPNSRLEWIDDARTFSAEDNPARLADLITAFVRGSG